MEKKRPTNFRLTAEAKRLLQALARQRGISMAALLEVVIREEAERKGIQ